MILGLLSDFVRLGQNSLGIGDQADISSASIRLPNGRRPRQLRTQDAESVVPEAGVVLGVGLAAGALDLLSAVVAPGLLSASAAAFPDSFPDSAAGALLLAA